MKTRTYLSAISMMVSASLALVLWPSGRALALIPDGSATPPNGWDHLCSPQSITVSPRPTSRIYSATATCWVNLSSDKSSDNSSDSQQWVQAQTTMKGQYFLSTPNKFHEAITVNLPRGAVTIVVNGSSCADDPWATQASCAANYAGAMQLAAVNFGWMYIGSSVGDAVHQGPLSRALFDPSLIQAQLKKQESNPPDAPGGVQAVLWPTQDGRSAIANVSWHAGDMSNNKWVFTFDIESTQFADGTFTNAGHRVGPGPKQNMSAADANRVYVFTPTASLQNGGTYFFRVCSVNDAGRQCSATVQARAPTQQERMGRSSGMHVVAGGILKPIGTNPLGGGSPGGPIALGTARTGGTSGGGAGAPSSSKGPTPLGTARPVTPIALGTARPGGTGGSTGGSLTGGNGPTPTGAAKPIAPIALGTTHLGSPTESGGGASGGTTIAGGHPPTSIGGSKPGAPGGVTTSNGIGTLRPIGPIAGIGHPGAQPGEVAFPDLAVGPAMLVHDQRVMWGSATTLNLRADATHTCPLPVSFQFRNAGNGPAQNVTAEIRDGLNAMQPVAVQNLASMVAGQASSVGGVWKVGLLPTPRAVIVEARVREAGGIHEKDLANNHGAVTLNLTCK